MLSRADIRRIADRSRRDPAWFVRHVLAIEPTPYQVAFLEALRDHRLVSVRSCHGIGKSGFAGGMAVPWFLVTHPDSEIITTAPTFRQVRGILWKEVARSHSRARLPLGGEVLQASATWRISESWFAFGFTTEHSNPDRFQGWHPASGHGLVVVDEAAGVEQRLYDEGISSIISSEGSKLLLIGNPTNPVGEFRDSHRPSSAYRRFKVDAFSTPNFTAFGITVDDIRSGSWEQKITGPLPRPYLITPQWVADRFRKWGESSPLFQARVLADFPVSSSNNLIPMHLLESARERDLSQELQGWPTDGIDVSAGGEDFSVRGRAWPSGYYRRQFKGATPDTNVFAERLFVMLSADGPSQPIAVNVDSIGVGRGVYDRLASLGPWHHGTRRPIAICRAEGSFKPRDTERFVNARAEWFWNLRERFERGAVDIDPTDEDLYYQLSELRYEIRNGKIKIEDKDDCKKRLGVSPDDADAMAYAFADLESDRATVLL